MVIRAIRGPVFRKQIPLRWHIAQILRDTSPHCRHCDPSHRQDSQHPAKLALRAASAMKNRWIAGLLLLTLLTWANSPAWPGPEPASRQISASAVAPEHQHSPGNGHHSCCPNKPLQITLQAPLSPAMPCGDHHRCCILQSPGAPLGLPVSSERSRPGADIAISAVAVAPDRVSSDAHPGILRADALRPYPTLSMIFRV